jgi:S-adenosylhomocysteine hydrolase
MQLRRTEMKVLVKEYISTTVNMTIDDGEEETRYVRNGPESWMEWMGESLETCYDDAWLEEIYQEHKFVEAKYKGKEEEDYDVEA